MDSVLTVFPRAEGLKALQSPRDSRRRWQSSTIVADLDLLNCHSQRQLAPQRTWVEISKILQVMCELPYAAVAANSSDCLAVDRMLTERAKRIVHTVSKPNLVADAVTKYRDMIAPLYDFGVSITFQGQV